MNKKFELTKETVDHFGIVLYRIRALRSFIGVEEGQLGGFVEKEINLSHEGDSWVYGDSQVFGDSWVYGNSRVYGNSQVFGDSRVYGKVKLKSALCSRFGFGFQWQVALWLKKEKEYEAAVKKRMEKVKK
jgi:hypothetical protein